MPDRVLGGLLSVTSSDPHRPPEVRALLDRLEETVRNRSASDDGAGSWSRCRTATTTPAEVVSLLSSLQRSQTARLARSRAAPTSSQTPARETGNRLRRTLRHRRLTCTHSPRAALRSTRAAAARTRRNRRRGARSRPLRVRLRLGRARLVRTGRLLDRGRCWARAVRPHTPTPTASASVEPVAPRRLMWPERCLRAFTTGVEIAVLAPPPTAVTPIIDIGRRTTPSRFPIPETRVTRLSPRRPAEPHV